MTPKVNEKIINKGFEVRTALTMVAIKTPPNLITTLFLNKFNSFFFQR